MKRVDNLYEHQFDKNNIICPHGESFYCKKCIETYNPREDIYDNELREIL